MDLPETQLQRLLEDRTVQILGDGVTGGSGFFVAPGEIITCAHVVAKSDDSVAEAVTVEWAGQSLQGRVRVAPARPGPTAAGREPASDRRAVSHLWAYPDLCVIELGYRPKDQGSVILGDLRGVGHSPVYLTGFGAAYDSEPGFQGKSAWFDGPQDLDGRFWQIGGSEIAAGLSGGPVLDLRSGDVCAVIKSFRSPDSDRGGLVVPAGAIRDAFPELWARNQEASKREDQWTALRDALRERFDPLDQILTESERQGLIEADRRLALPPARLNRLWLDIVGPFGPAPDRGFEGVIGLASALADLPRSGLDPVIKLFARLEAMLEDPGLNGLRGMAEGLATRNRQADELSRYQADLKLARTDEDNRVDEGDRPVIVVLLSPDGSSQKKYVWLKAWTYPDGKTPGLPVRCALGPHPVRSIREIATEVLSQEIDKLPRVPLIEFALPDHMLDDAVEKWKIDGWESGKCEAGADYPVVVRFGERVSKSMQKLRENGSFGNLRLPPNDDLIAWDNLWVGCRDDRTFDQFNGIFKRQGRLPFVAMTAWYGVRRLPYAVEAARHAGLPAILWHHKPCSDHPAAASDGSGRLCRGDRFRQAVIDRLSGTALRDLPNQIFQFRAQIAADGDPACPGCGIAILWDNPDRLPWMESPQSRVPENWSG